MIISFRHKGLKCLYATGSGRGVQAEHVPRLRRLLAALDVATRPRDLDCAGNRLHLLKGDLAGYWSISVSGNWRIIYRFTGEDVELLDYLDYH